MSRSKLGKKLVIALSLLGGTASQLFSLQAEEKTVRLSILSGASQPHSDSALAEPTPARPRDLSEGTPTPARKQLRVAAVERDESKEASEPLVAVPQAADEGPVEIVEQRYANGALMLEREVIQDAEGNYINHGSWRMWDQEGNLVVEGRCRDNQLHGEWRRIYYGTESKLFSQSPYDQFEGPFISDATFEDGMLHGSWIVSDAQERKISVIEFADGHRQGFARWWYPNGKKMQEIPFKNGFAHGEVRMWSSEGDLTAEQTFNAGHQLTTKLEYYTPGVKKTETSYLQPQLILQSADDWWNAKLAIFTTQGQMEKHGPQTRWFPNGQKQLDAEYRHGQLDGRCTWWYLNGQREAEGSFTDGKPTDSWTWWHSNGQKSAAGQYTDGAIVGTWAWWLEDGRLKNRIATDTNLPTTPDTAAEREASLKSVQLPEVHVR